MKLTVTVDEVEPGRWLATAESYRGEGRTEEEALADLRKAAAGPVVAPPVSSALP
jgi:hypothetical protein